MQPIAGAGAFVWVWLGAVATDSTWTRLWREPQEVGGTTGYRDRFPETVDRPKALAKKLASLQRGQVLKAHTRRVGPFVPNPERDSITADPSERLLSQRRAGLWRQPPRHAMRRPPFADRKMVRHQATLGGLATRIPQQKHPLRFWMEAGV